MMFSIIIPVYNVAPYLRECLDSVLAQTYPDWEAICVDDGSTDDSGKILDEYAALDSRLLVIHQNNAGVSVARNTALDCSTGDWLCFIDSDDIVDSEWLSCFAKTIESSHSLEVIRTGYRMFDDKGAKSEVLLDEVEIEGEDAVRNWCWREIPGKGYVWALAIKRSVLQASRFEVGVRLAEDTLFSLSVLKKVKHAKQCGFTGYNYRQTETSCVRKKISSDERVLFFAAFLREFADLRGTGVTRYTSWCLFYSLVCWIRLFSDLTQRHQIHKTLLKCWSARIFNISELKLHWRLPIAIYLLLGWLWPIRLNTSLLMLRKTM